MSAGNSHPTMSRTEDQAADPSRDHTFFARRQNRVREVSLRLSLEMLRSFFLASTLVGAFAPVEAATIKLNLGSFSQNPSGDMGKDFPISRLMRPFSVSGLCYFSIQAAPLVWLFLSIYDLDSFPLHSRPLCRSWTEKKPKRRTRHLLSVHATRRYELKMPILSCL